MTRKSPSVLGFFKEGDGPETIVSRVHADSAGLYVHLPSHLRNRLEVLLEQVHSGADMPREIHTDALLEVKGYWHELYLPDEVVKTCGIRCHDLLKLTLYRIYQHGRIITV